MVEVKTLFERQTVTDQWLLGYRTMRRSLGKLDPVEDAELYRLGSAQLDEAAAQLQQLTRQWHNDLEEVERDLIRIGEHRIGLEWAINIAGASKERFPNCLWHERHCEEYREQAQRRKEVDQCLSVARLYLHELGPLCLFADAPTQPRSAVPTCPCCGWHPGDADPRGHVWVTLGGIGSPWRPDEPTLSHLAWFCGVTDTRVPVRPPATVEVGG